MIPPGPIGWAAFLACSWTWCIGMFLPVLMLRDYGAWGWWVFAVPNVLGAAAMGWMLRDPAASRALQQNHLAACRAFSWVTLSFHAYFIIALLPLVLGNGIIALTAVCIPAVLALRRARGRWVTLSAALVLSVSVLAMLAVLALQGVPTVPGPSKDRTDLFWLAAVCGFGFLLDPYLDLTFHRARQMTTRAGGRTAFGLGFGVFFLLMIVFTAIYARRLIEVLAAGQPLEMRDDPFAAALGVHVALQTAFTVVAHADSLRSTPRAALPGQPELPRHSRWAGLIATTGILVLALGLRVLRTRFPHYRSPVSVDGGLSTSEVIYRAFLAFYGLVFPAYVWLFVVPRRTRGGVSTGIVPTRGQAIYFAAVTALAAPMFWAAFIEGRMVWLAPGLVVVLLARFLLPKPAVPESAGTP
jgi:hypothetical protein